MPKIPHRLENGTALKRCSKCKDWKQLGEYHKDKALWDSLRPNCKKCTITQVLKYRKENRNKISAQNREYREKNKERLAAKKKEYNEKNKERLAARKRDYYKKNKERLAARNRDYYKKNKEKIAAKQCEYHKKNKEKIAAKNCEYYIKNKEKLTAKQREYNRKNEVKERRNKKACQRRKWDSQYRMSMNIRSMLHKSLKTTKLKKNSRTFKYIDCTPEFLLARLQKQCKERGLNKKYHIDHMLPLDSFDLSNPEQLKRAWHWSNLQAISPKENLRKSNKVIYNMRWSEKRDQWLIRNEQGKGPYRPTALFRSLLFV